LSESLRTRLAQRALSLCEIASPYGEERAIADLVEAWARSPGMSLKVERLGNAVIVGSADPKKPTLGLVGHLDTVPAAEEATAPRIDGDRLIGLGSSDMKGALAVMQCLIEDLQRAPSPLQLMAIFYDKEEGPHADSGLATVLAKRPDLVAIDLAIVMEPTDGVVQVGCLGSIHATVTFAGKAAHSARPWQGRNAITRAGAFLARLDAAKAVEVEVGGHRFTEVATVTLAEGGHYRNVVPDRFTLNLNTRFAPGVSLAAAKARVEALLEGESECTVEFTDLAPAGGVPEDNPLLDRLVATGELAIAPKIAWTDVARFSEAGIDAVNYGPGLGAQAHQAGEYADLPALVTAYETLATFITDAT